ncbi:hydroxyethylthiazole kinase [Komagataeibacter diospyri]|uniref:Hydroxyethylthiazole kinase n=1 Tax=Komagataeibacter diospyri TaxID=1932662 RepID=A0A4P5NZ55_9PROT|nr:hydroxyethylthiazole kinase [Komagataeibacter diospyri]GCE82467.1 hydroxyethylthiazole kinase [Komagataeibacter diospyri]GCE88821.1 hydroxyethylthiazole kinase [Komagataeibacter diospyri]
MKHVTWEHDNVRQTWQALPVRKPFIYGQTNYIAATLSANVLLAAGAVTAIGAIPSAVEIFASNADAIWINAAAQVTDPPEQLFAAARIARDKNIPWVLDPVAMGAGAETYDNVIRQLLTYRPAVIRGNASELMALAGGAGGTKGVEATLSPAAALAAARDLACRSGAVVAISGPVDHITDGTSVRLVPGGSPMLTRITGAGCSLGALVAALLRVAATPLEAATVAHAAYAIAAERAAERARGPASFTMEFVDALSCLADN